MADLFKILKERQQQTTTDVGQKDNACEVTHSGALSLFKPAATEDACATPISRLGSVFESSPLHEEPDLACFGITLLLPDEDWPVLPDGKWQRKDNGFLVTFDNEEELYWTLVGKAASLRQRFDDFPKQLELGSETTRMQHERIREQLLSLEASLNAYRANKPTLLEVSENA